MFGNILESGYTRNYGKWVSVTLTNASSDYRWKRQPPDMEGRCEYTESTVMDSQ